MRFPEGPDRIAVAAAAVAWAGALAGLAGPVPAGVACTVAVAAALVAARRVPAASVLVIVLVAAAGSGVLSRHRAAATLAADVPAGLHTLAGRLAGDARPSGDGFRFSFQPSHLASAGAWTSWRGPLLLVVADRRPGAAAGERAVVRGTVRAQPGRWRGDPVAGVVRARSVQLLARASDPLFRVGNLLRRRVMEGLAPYRPAPEAALLGGFLIGEVAELPGADVEALRRSGLTHFVAVSGSNVALFLAAWWLVAGPLAGGPRRRAVWGLVGLAVFVVVTRWEPSVVRAATMAAIVLSGRLVGLPVGAWGALGSAVALLLVVSGELALDVGFQLSAAATAGVLLGAGLARGRRPRWAWGAVGATAAAQAAVAPLLLAHFGTMALLAPFANLLAGPLVAAATITGGIGVMAGFGPAVELGLVAGRGVLIVARAAGSWPQLGWGGAGALALLGALASRPRLRPSAAVLGAAALLVVLLGPVRLPDRPAVVFLDVGQGDAVLVLGAGGATVLVDGGPDEAGLRDALRRYGIQRIDLMVLSHPHADHVTGLLEAVRSLPVGRLWHPAFPGGGPLVGELLAQAHERSVPVEVPAPGWTATIGDLRVEVHGPRRRYASPNDQSIVLTVDAGGRRLLLPGDVEKIAQRELGALDVDVLKVPHQGAATSDLGWLAANAGEVAVISVGPNDFGHPSAAVIEALTDAGAEVRRTDEEGDVSISLGR